MPRKNRHLKKLPKATSSPTKSKTNRTFITQPRVFCTLNPESGAICIELPGSNGRRQPIEVKSIDTIRTILMHQLTLAQNQQPFLLQNEVWSPTGRLESADPTEAQIRHWEDHSRRGIKAKMQSNCPFCIAEARNPDALITNKKPSARKYDTRGNLIRVVHSASELGLVKRPKPASPATNEKE